MMESVFKVKSQCTVNSYKYQYFVLLFLWLFCLCSKHAYGTIITWSGSGFDDNWSNGNNWFGSVPPTSTDSVIFNANDSGNINIVDTDFTIADLQYIGNSTHTTDFNGSNNLQISGAANIGVGYSGDDSATVTWTNGGKATIGGLAIGHNNGITNDIVSGSLLIENTSLNAFTEGLTIGLKAWGGSGGAEGYLILGENSKLNIDNSGWWMNIGANLEGDVDSEAVGLLDTRLGEAKLATHTLSIGSASSYGQGKAEGTLILGSDDIVRADQVYVGNGNDKAKGVLEAVEGDVDFRTRSLLIGNGGTGILRWDQLNPLYAENILFGYGDGLGILDIPDGGTCKFGSESELASLGIGIGASYGGTPTAEGFDFSIKDPVFEAYLNSLSVGWNPAEGSGKAQGSLILGNNSKLRVGELTNYGTGTGTVNVGVTLVSPAEAVGILDTVRGDTEIHVTNINIGGVGSYSPGSANGTFTMGSDNVVTTDMLGVGVGTNATGTVNLTGGLLAAKNVYMGAGGTFNFNNGRLAIGTFNTYEGLATLTQQGGTLAPGFSRTEFTKMGKAILNGDYEMAVNALLEIELFGLTAGDEYDQLVINGGVNLDADGLGGGMLDLILGFEPEIGDSFLIIDNDGTDPIQGIFAGFPNGSLLSETYMGWIYSFQISYMGYTGNDVVLNTESITPVPVPGGILLGGIGITFSGWLLRRRRAS